VSAGKQLVAAVFASGGGSNLQSLLDHQGADTPWRIGLVVSDRAGAGALARAEASGVPHRVIPTKNRDPQDVADETLASLHENGVQVIFLAGYLKLLPAAVVQAFAGRIINIHPALLPAFGGKGMWGMHVHRAVIESGSRLSGPTVHFVDEEYDRGRILAQWPVPVLPGDSPEALAARVLAVEHRLYPLAADHLCRALAEGRESGPLAPPGDTFELVTQLS
jgi:formyltetrahydrofolate-dependent phosphoribosylglycinamide formyltransferase